MAAFKVDTTHVQNEIPRNPFDFRIFCSSVTYSAAYQLPTLYGVKPHSDKQVLIDKVIFFHNLYLFVCKKKVDEFSMTMTEG
jgi:hypothetical protein